MKTTITLITLFFAVVVLSVIDVIYAWCGNSSEGPELINTVVGVFSFGVALATIFGISNFRQWILNSNRMFVVRTTTSLSIVFLMWSLVFHCWTPAPQFIPQRIVLSPTYSGPIKNLNACDKEIYRELSTQKLSAKFRFQEFFCDSKEPINVRVKLVRTGKYLSATDLNWLTYPSSVRQSESNGPDLLVSPKSALISQNSLLLIQLTATYKGRSLFNSPRETHIFTIIIEKNGLEG